MRIKQLKIAGFRGFNEEQVIDFHDRLTVISAPNSHGKTSISEALEFLIYGTTSKVEKADSKEEYKDSYRNRHFPVDSPTYIEVTVVATDDTDMLLRVELDADGVIKRFINGNPTDRWSFQEESLAAARPFVLQHALKYLLLVPPSERFQGFAQLLGLNKVDEVFRAILSLCTKPSANISEEGQKILTGLASLEVKITTFTNLKSILTIFKKGSSGLQAAYELIENRADKLLEGKDIDKSQLENLIAVRTAAAAKIYSGDVSLQPLSATDLARLSSFQKTLSETVNNKFIEDYGYLCIKGISDRLKKEAKLLDIGVELLKEDPKECPLCKQLLDEGTSKVIHERHASARTDIQEEAGREQARIRVVRSLENIKTALKEHFEICIQPLANLIASMQPENAKKVAELLGGTDVATVGIIRAAAGTASNIQDCLQVALTKSEIALGNCETTVTTDTLNLSDVEVLGEALKKYLAAASDATESTKTLDSDLVGPAKLFKQAVDALAGTAEISLIIELLEKRSLVKQGLRIRDVIEGLKNFKKYAEQTLAEIMETAMNTDLTAAVMKWYSQIKTIGDPEVHFSGFTMDRTKSGEFKSRRLSVKAESYGVELASAVSSLSESKLNALGLCVSIASAIRKPGPWSFLVIDDPIQSWDDEHETQFVNVIRNLVELEGKQVIVLSHKGTWAKQVCDGCRTINGFRYEITGYTKIGPNIIPLDWSPLKERLREAEIIANDATSSSVRLQQAEEELRIAACQLASLVAKEKLNRVTSPHNMNKGDVRAIFIAAGIESNITDSIQAMFVNADDSHHSPKTYQPNAQRVRQAIPVLRQVLMMFKK